MQKERSLKEKESKIKNKRWSKINTNLNNNSRMRTCQKRNQYYRIMMKE